MGTGKTLVAIAITGALYGAGKIRRALVVAPLSVLGVWREEFAKHADFPHSLEVLAGPTAKKAAALSGMAGPGLRVAVVNYESARLLEREIRAWRPCLIIADEGHKIKAHGAATSKAMHRLGAMSPHRLLLTGTPVVNKPIDVFSQYKFLDPRVFGNSFYAFRGRYFDMTGYGQHVPVMKKDMEPEFARRLHGIAFRATKAECLDLPEATDVVRHVELEPEAMRIYMGIAKENVAELGGGELVTATNILAKLLRLTQLTGGFLGGDGGGPPRQVSSAKLAALADIVDSAAHEGRKLVVIARFLPEIGAICDMLEKRGIGHVCVKGGVRDRQGLVDAFQTKPEALAFVGQVAAAGLGLTLTAADTMAFYSLDYSAANHDQCRARIHRAGQRNKCTYVYIQARGTADAKVLRALRGKADLARALIDDYRRGLNPFLPTEGTE